MNQRGKQSKWLQEGKQTKNTPLVEEIARSLSGDKFKYIVKVMEWMRENLKLEQDERRAVALLRRRTASQIIASGISSGCGDYALVFTALARAKGIPTRYVETINESWLRVKEPSGTRGHVYTEVIIDGKEYKVDPTYGTIQIGICYPKKKVLGRGLDAWDLGIKDHRSLLNKFVGYAKLKSRLSDR